MTNRLPTPTHPAYQAGYHSVMAEVPPGPLADRLAALVRNARAMGNVYSAADLYRDMMRLAVESAETSDLHESLRRIMAAYRTDRWERGRTVHRHELTDALAALVGLTRDPF